MRETRRLKEERQQTSTIVIPQIEKHVEHTSKRFDCSKSWVIATALADFFGIEIERYDSSKDKLRRVK